MNCENDPVIHLKNPPSMNENNPPINLSEKKVENENIGNHSKDKTGNAD